MHGESEAKVKSSDTSDQPLRTLGKYTIDRMIGQGGMGAVYLAHRSDLKKSVALKVLPKDKARNPTLVKRFKAEAQAAGQLEHPNIVAVYDTGDADGFLYIAMEYVDGVDLFEHLKKRRLVPVTRSIEIIKQVAAALQHAYEQNIVHRDIKPSNLLLRRDGVVKVTDLGLARSIDESVETNITRAGTTVGTVDYMAPEQARNSKAADIRSDIYSLGCTWFQMLTGVPPFHEGSMTNKLHAHAVKPLPDPRSLNEAIPEGVYAILQRMTSKRPEDRYQTPADLLEDLKHAKLTRTAFSNEILADLTDDDLGITSRVADHQEPPAEDSEIYDAEFPDYPDETTYENTAAPAVDRSPKNRKSDAPARKPGRSADDEDRRTSESGHDEPVARKATSSEPRNGPDEGDLARRPKKPRSPASDEEPNDRPASRSTGKSEKSESTKGQGERGAPSKFSPKPLPPKRQPLAVESGQTSTFNLDFLKQASVITVIAGAIVGIGWMIFLWSGAMDADQPAAQAIKSAAPANNPPVEAKPAPTVEPPKQPEPVAVSATESPEQTAAEIDVAKQPLPKWATTPSEIRDLPVFTVGSGPKSEKHFSRLADAIAAADQKAVHIRLQGNEPFLLASAKSISAKRIVISPASPDDRPLIVMSSSDVGTGIHLKNGELDLRDLNFVINRTHAKNGVQNSMVTVTNGQLLVRNCSFTAEGDDSIPANAVHFEGNWEAGSKTPLDPILLMDHTVIRGNGVTALSLRTTRIDAVIQNSLSVTGNAPAIRLSGLLSVGDPDTDPSGPRRIIRVLQSTLSCRKDLIDISGDSSAKPPTTEFLLQDTICSAEGAGNTAVLINASRWPNTSSNTSSKWLTNLNWTSVSSLFFGFDQLVELHKGQFKVKGPDTWARVWNSKPDVNQFQSSLWQEAALPATSSVVPALFNRETLRYRDIKTATGGLPGCDVSQLKVPESVSHRRLLAVSQHPALPAPPSSRSEPPQIIKVDLKTDDLGNVINRPNWPSGTEFHAVGTGIRQMTPVKVIDKSLRIVFFSDGNLKIAAKAGDKKQDLPALISIENGTLEIESMTLDAAQAPKAGATGWLIEATNANLYLKGCHLNGPLQNDLEQHKGLIHWTTTEEGKPAKDSELPIFSLTDCLLMSPGVGIKSDCARGKFFIQNSILAIRGAGLDVNLTGVGTAVPPVFCLEHVSVSASRSAIRLERSIDAPLASPARVFVEDCAFVAPLDFKDHEAREATAIECAGTLMSPHQVEWWGNSNAFSKEIAGWFKRPDGTLVQSAADWTEIWGESSDVRLLTDPAGLQLQIPLPTKWRDLKASSFIIDPYCSAATWALDGHEVGANIKAIEEAIDPRKPIAEPKPSTTKPAQPSRPVGKQQPGF